MNNFEIIIEEFNNQYEANKGVNESIKTFTQDNREILDIKSHIIKAGDGESTYVFIYKVSNIKNN